MNIPNLLIGILITGASFIYIIRVIRDAQKDKDYDYILLSLDINIVVPLLIFFIIGLILIYREIKVIL